jgi:hypothetical protein
VSLAFVFGFPRGASLLHAPRVANDLHARAVTLTSQAVWAPGAREYGVRGSWLNGAAKPGERMARRAGERTCGPPLAAA